MRRWEAIAALLVLTSICALAQDQIPAPVTVCELEANPAAYNHERIQVQGVVSHEFEDFSLHAKCSPLKTTVWLMYGGDAPDAVTYCCNGTGRKSAVRIEGIDVPLKKDGTFQRFERLLNSYRIKKNQKVIYFQTDPSYRVEATLVGRYFSGDGGRGFGHMGCCSLLVIEQVLSIDSIESNGQMGESDCYTEGWYERRSQEDLVAANRLALTSGARWRIHDARKVAEEALDSYLKTSEQPPTPPRFLSCKKKHLTYPDGKDDQYEYSCWWSAGPSDSYSVDLLKLWFLKTPSNSWSDIAWMPNEVSHRHCSDHGSKPALVEPAQDRLH